MSKIKINRRTSFGFAWTNDVVRINGRLTIADPGLVPVETGSINTILRKYLEAASINSGNDWARRWFVKHDGKWLRVIDDVGAVQNTLQMLAWEVIDDDSVDVED